MTVKITKSARIFTLLRYVFLAFFTFFHHFPAGGNFFSNSKVKLKVTEELFLIEQLIEIKNSKFQNYPDMYFIYHH